PDHPKDKLGEKEVVKGILHEEERERDEQSTEEAPEEIGPEEAPRHDEESDDGREQRERPNPRTDHRPSDSLRERVTGIKAKPPARYGASRGFRDPGMEVPARRGRRIVRPRWECRNETKAARGFRR